MSKSHGNTLEVFGDEKLLKKKIMSIVMDSRSPTDLKPDANRNTAIQLLKLVAPEDVSLDAEMKLREGQLGYGTLKGMLFEHCTNYFAKPRELYNDLKKHPDYVEAILKDGAARAECTTSFTMKNVRKAVGL